LPPLREGRFVIQACKGNNYFPNSS
jgi:hypothetical protein